MHFISKTPQGPTKDTIQDSQSESASFVPIFPVILDKVETTEACTISSETTSSIQIVSLLIVLVMWVSFLKFAFITHTYVYYYLA